MATVHFDLQEGAGGKVTADGYEIERIARVSGLTGTAYARLKQAVAALAAKNAAIGKSHPSITKAKLAEMPFEHESPSVMKFRLLYREPDWSGGTTDPETDDPEHQQIEIGTSLQSVQTNKDVNGDLMEVEFDGKKQSGEVSVMRPLSTIVVRRREGSSPGHKSRVYVGKLNAAGQFALAAPDTVGGTWICTGINGTSNDGGATWAVVYSFEYDELGWDHEAVYNDPDTGRVPDGVIDGTDAVKALAIRTYAQHKAVNFNLLNLT